MKNVDKTSFGVPPQVLSSLGSDTQELICRLLQHDPEPVDLSPYPTNKLAAVLVLLYERNGCAQVLLTTRSKQLRTHPGQTALPGGRCDETDENLLETATREANEEVSLPLNLPCIHPLCVLPPSISLYGMIVTPVVCYLSDTSVLNCLAGAEAEVDRIFEHPLEALLSPQIAASLSLSELGGEDWPYKDELHNTTDSKWLNGSSYRMHRFRSMASPIKGLTADILIKVAEIAFGRRTSYDRWAAGQVDSFAEMAKMLAQHEQNRHATVRSDTERLHSSQEHLPAE